MLGLFTFDEQYFGRECVPPQLRLQNSGLYLRLKPEPVCEGVDDAPAVAGVGEDEPEEDGEQGGLGDLAKEEVDVRCRANQFRLHGLKNGTIKSRINK